MGGTRNSAGSKRWEEPEIVQEEEEEPRKIVQEEVGGARKWERTESK